MGEMSCTEPVFRSSTSTLSAYNSSFMTTIVHHGSTETRRDLIFGDLSGAVIAAAIEVHTALGPGLLESAYEVCLCRELDLRNIRFRRQVELPVSYKGTKLEAGYRMDLVVEEKLIVEIKAVERILQVHEAQLLTYMRLSGIRVGLLFNFCVPTMNRGGIVRRVL